MRFEREVARDIKTDIRIGNVTAPGSRAGASVKPKTDAGQPMKTVERDDQAQAFRIATRRRNDDPASLLEPVAASLANLLTSDKFEYVKQCEAHDCVLLFHDLTKSHRRRWCSMATC